MDVVLRASSSSSFVSTVPCISTTNKTQLPKPIFFNSFLLKPGSNNSSYTLQLHRNQPKSRLFTALSSSSTTEESIEPPQPEDEINDSGEEKFDWFSEWYPLMPVCDLDKRVPHGKKILGLDLVLWWDRNENEWKVFDDTCPHRLAPLSDGRIDQWGRLQCVYHGWCFSGDGGCKFIPQAPADGPPVHTSKKACVAVYPSTVQHGIVWVWPNSDPQYKDILMKKKPPYIPVLDDPSFTKMMANREVPYGYEVLTENLMDPAHVVYAHHGLIGIRTPKEKADREGGKPLGLSVKKLDINGITGKNDFGDSNFIAPCIFHTVFPFEHENGSLLSSETEKEAQPAIPRAFVIFMCIPVSPGNSRVISVFPRNFDVWIDKIVPRWMIHIGQNLIFDSDLYLLHVVERKLMEIGNTNWQKAYSMPTKSDAFVVGFRRWFNKYAGGQIDWKGKYTGALPPTPPREQLMDRYWSHVVNCTSCNTAYKGLNTLEVILQIVSITAIGIVALTKHNTMSMMARTTMVSVAIICFAASKWLAHFIHKTFHFHDYNHAFK